MNSRHYAVIDPYKRKVVIKYGDQVIVESENASILKEVGKSVYDPVLYFPKEDFKAKLVNEPEKRSHCPIKGDATYWNLSENPTSDYFAWSYEEALPNTRKIKGLIAINTEYVSIYSEPMDKA